LKSKRLILKNLNLKIFQRNKLTQEKLQRWIHHENGKKISKEEKNLMNGKRMIH